MGTGVGPGVGPGVVWVPGNSTDSKTCVALKVTAVKLSLDLARVAAEKLFKYSLGGLHHGRSGVPEINTGQIIP